MFSRFYIQKNVILKMQLRDLRQKIVNYYTCF